MLPLLQHLLNPGDHYSPSTGSAVVTVVHGLTQAHQQAGGDSTVAVARGTYTDRYAEGRVIEYQWIPAGFPQRRQRWKDAALGVIGCPRRASREPWKPAVKTVVPDGVVLVHNGTQAGALLPRGAHRVLYAHNTLLRSYSPWEARKLVHRFDQVITVSRFLADEIERRAGRRRLVSVVRNGVDLEQFYPAAQRDPGPPRVLFVGRVIPEKGAHLLVQAALRLRHLDFIVNIVGSEGFASNLPISTYEKQLRWAAAPLDQRVRFSPFVDRRHLPALMREADIVVVPSIVREGLGLVLLEAMASGAACISADSGGLAEAAGAAAVLFPRQDVAALGEVLEELLADETARRRVGSACLARASGFTWSASHKQLLASL